MIGRDYRWYYYNRFCSRIIPEKEFALYENKVLTVFSAATSNAMEAVYDRMYRSYEINEKPTPEDKELDKIVANAICRAANALYDFRKTYAGFRKGIKSESNDGASVTYETVSPFTLEKQENKLILKTLKGCLAGTGLLYRGVR
ncbi:MAG: hypothetical protein ACI4RP_06820 [Acutalibacteraceae bacterium]